ncbi:hypothetical protein HDV63DRAFT_180203 [Trichoderma sp. SZMC 28014]
MWSCFVLPPSSLHLVLFHTCFFFTTAFAYPNSLRHLQRLFIFCTTQLSLILQQLHRTSSGTLPHRLPQPPHPSTTRRLYSSIYFTFSSSYSFSFGFIFLDTTERKIHNRHVRPQQIHLHQHRRRDVLQSARAGAQGRCADADDRHARGAGGGEWPGRHLGLGACLK